MHLIGQTPRSATEDVAMATYLLEAGAEFERTAIGTDPNPARLHTPLAMAAGRCNSPLVDFLLLKGASTETQNEDGLTVLGAAVAMLRNATPDEYLPVLRLLLDHGADPLAGATLARSALQVSLAMNMEPAYRLLSGKVREMEVSKEKEHHLFPTYFVAFVAFLGCTVICLLCASVAGVLIEVQR